MSRPIEETTINNELKVTYVSPAKLKPAPYNPRQMSEAAFAKLKRGIEQYGLVDPLVVRRTDQMVIGGHQRLEAAKDLSLDTVPVVYLSGLTDQEAAALNVLLNNPNAQGEWDMPKLSELLSELDVNGFDATITGFDEKELEDILTWAPDGTEGEGKVDLTPPKKPKSKRGKIYELGRHRLMCGDATEWELRDTVDVVITDPPYGIHYKTMRDGREIRNDSEVAGDIISGTFGRIQSAAWFVFCDLRSLGTMCLALEKHATPPKACIVWDKSRGVQNLDRFAKSHELILYAGPFGGRKTLDRDVWVCDRDYGPDHPTAKPVELAARAIRYTSRNGESVADPFAGSGFSLIAAEQLNRICYAMEIEPAYCDVIRRRYSEFVNDPTLAP